MDNHIFRSAALGFNRQDVMEYIEKTQKEAEANAAALSRQLDEAMEELAQLRLRLEERGEEADRLGEELAEIRRQYDQEKAEREELAQESARQSEAVRTLTKERDRLSSQVDRLNSQKESLRQEKEKLAQLELDAHRRADELLAQTQEEADLRLSEAQSRAEGLINAASAQAEDTVAQAQAQREDLLRETEARIERTVQECGQLFETCERITAHVTSELRKMGSANAKLPTGLRSLKKSLTELQEKAKDR
ncbi:MAG: hypothetical protein HDT18_08080 [Oscillibacter sp.]|nr:hypothetical protein [Oscillibacter sp.]